MSHSDSDRTTRGNSKTDNLLASLTTAVKETNKNVNDMRAELKTKISDLETKFLDKFVQMDEKIDAKLQQFSITMNAKIADIQKQHDVNLSHFTAGCTAVSLQCNKNSKRLDTIELKDNPFEIDVIISGIIYIDGEDLLGIIQKICAVVECKHTALTLIKDIFRTSSPIAGKPGLIILKFNTKYLKKQFMIAYSKHKSLCLKDIGFHSEGRIYINDSLSPENRIMFNNARKLVKNNALSGAMIKRGTIFIKKIQCEDYTKCTPEQLTELINESGATSSDFYKQ